MQAVRTVSAIRHELLTPHSRRINPSRPVKIEALRTPVKGITVEMNMVIRQDPGIDPVPCSFVNSLRESPAVLT